MGNKAYVFCVVAGVLFINGQKAGAEEPNEDVNYEAQSPRVQKSDGKMTLSTQLETAILRWHDAMIDADSKEVTTCQQIVLRLLNEDIKELEKQVKALEHKAVSAKSTDGNPIDRSKEGEARELLHEKKQLIASIKNSTSFGTTYRLLGDYLYLLRQDEAPALAGTVDSNSFTDSLK